MSLAYAEQALRAAAATAIATIGQTIVNAGYTPPAGTKWARISVQSNQPTAHTMGPGGQDEVTGILFVELSYPLAGGESAAATDYETLRSAFPGGKILSSSGQYVHINNTGKTTTLEASTFRMTVKVSWYAFLSR